MRKLHISILLAILLISFPVNISAEEFNGNKKLHLSGDVKRDKTTGSADYFGRIILSDEYTLKPYLLTGANLNWTSEPKTFTGKRKSALERIEGYGVGVNLGTGFLWNISSGISIFAEPSVRYNLFKKNLNTSQDSNNDPDSQKKEESLKMGIHLGF